MQQYDRYPYNDDYNGNSVFQENQHSKNGSCLGAILIGLIFGVILGGDFLIKTYPIIGWLLFMLGITAQVYIFYKIIKYLRRLLRNKQNKKHL